MKLRREGPRRKRVKPVRTLTGRPGGNSHQRRQARRHPDAKK